MYVSELCNMSAWSTVKQVNKHGFHKVAGMKKNIQLHFDEFLRLKMTSNKKWTLIPYPIETDPEVYNKSDSYWKKGV